MSYIICGLILIFAAGIAAWSDVEYLGEAFGFRTIPYKITNPALFIAGGILIGIGAKP